MHQAALIITLRPRNTGKKSGTLYPDAFVIAVKNNKILPLQDALNFKVVKHKQDLK